MATNLSETGIKQAIHSSLTEELRTQDRISSLPDTVTLSGKAHENWITVASNTLAAKIIHAISESSDNNLKIRAAGMEKTQILLRLSSFNEELKQVILSTIERTLRVLFPD